MDLVFKYIFKLSTYEYMGDFKNESSFEYIFLGMACGLINPLSKNCVLDFGHITPLLLLMFNNVPVIKNAAW